MRLFHVQDADRPVFVVAEDFSEALTMWRDLISAENEGDDCRGEFPAGIELLAHDSDLILGPPQAANPALDACRQILARLERTGNYAETQELLREAIAKTEGKEVPARN
jgi:hypothetical protein